MKKYQLTILFLIFLTGSSIIFYFIEEIQLVLKDNKKRVYKIYDSENLSKKSTNTSFDQYVLLASNFDETNKKFYYFYLPMVAEAWRKVGYKTIIFIVSSTDTDLENFNNNNPEAMKTLEYLKKLDIQLVQIKSEPHFGVMTSMISRLFVGAIDFLNDEDYVLTSDSDLFPIKKSYYQVQDYDAIGAWNGFCCGNFNLKNNTYEMYAMGHIGMKKKHWKGVMDVKSEMKIDTKLVRDLVRESIDETVVKEDEKIGRGDQTWYADQVILSSKIQIYSKKTNTNIRKRPYDGTRLDRILAPGHLNNLINNSFDRLTDFHAFHETYLSDYKITELLLKKLFDENLFLLMKNYTNEFQIIK